MYLHIFPKCYFFSFISYKELSRNLIHTSIFNFEGIFEKIL